MDHPPVWPRACHCPLPLLQENWLHTHHIYPKGADVSPQGALRVKQGDLATIFIVTQFTVTEYSALSSEVGSLC